jgi:hypothetical protein
MSAVTQQRHSHTGGAPEAALAALQMGGLPLQGMHIDPAVLGAFAAAAAAQQQAARVRPPGSTAACEIWNQLVLAKSPPHCCCHSCEVGTRSYRR